MKQFVLSASEFSDIKKAEAKVSEWWKKGNLENGAVKLYKIVEIYDLKLKFVKRRAVLKNESDC